MLWLLVPRQRKTYRGQTRSLCSPMSAHSILLYQSPLLSRRSDSAMDILRNPNANEASMTDWKNCASRSFTQFDGGIVFWCLPKPYLHSRIHVTKPPIPQS